MPKPGQKTVTLPAKIYDEAEKAAKAQEKSVAGYVTELIQEETQKHGS